MAIPLAKATALPDPDSIHLYRAGLVLPRRTPPIRCPRPELWVQNGYTTLSSGAAQLPRTKNP
jgi:hypothetical protein